MMAFGHSLTIRAGPSLALAAALLALSSVSCLHESQQSFAVRCQRTVDSFELLRAQWKAEKPSHAEQNGSGQPGAGVGLWRYFGVLRHLRMEPGFALDYYRSAEPNCHVRPLHLFARPVALASCSTSSGVRLWREWMVDLPPPRETEHNPNAQFMWRVMRAETCALDHVLNDSTPDGWFEMALLAEEGTQFGYCRECVLCDTAAVNRLRERTDPQVPSDVRFRITQDMLTPRIDTLGDTLRVAIAVYEECRGALQRECYYFRRTPPHCVLRVRHEELVASKYGGVQY
jgi:hypothetical protein